MKLFALSDPHLAFGVEGKSMDRFGAEWIDHPAKIETAWRELVGARDVVVVPGDISWAKKLPDAMPDLEWLDKLPGTKVILRGNHDLWWPTNAVLERELPPSIRFVQNNHAKAGPFVFFGSRMWDTTEYSVSDLIAWDPKKGPVPGSNGMMPGIDPAKQDEIYDHELHRLKMSAAGLPDGVRIGLTHYPPLDHLLNPSRASKLLEDAGAKHVIFGHLHSIREEWRGKAFGVRRDSSQGTEYHLAACDYVGFRPKLICEA
ncbi:MAG TPA: metallophosphoesterase [Fibrobacteria bacterium]|nr:metallophosphoesterase [Fibrobacteria bacterium]